MKAVITCYHKVYSSDVKVFIKVEDNLVLGFLKTGKKNLFHRDYVGAVKQITPLCVLDFYVHESMQRTGIGKVNKLICLVIIIKQIYNKNSKYSKKCWSAKIKNQPN